MLFMNQGIARTMMDYRTDRLEAACQKALSYGYDGAMFPWESDDAGEEACPTWALTGPLSIISLLISLLRLGIITV